MPLALELVATRIRLLHPEELLDRFGERLLLLTSGTADLPDRQRTLHATLDWSHRLLDSREQALFARLGVFSGGASLDAVEEVCGGEPVGDVLETLASLLEKSLVVTVDDAAGGPRVAMLQTVRAYAWEKLEDRGISRRLALGMRAVISRSWRAVIRPAGPARPTVGTSTPSCPMCAPPSGGSLNTTTPRRLALFASSLWTWYWIRGRMSEGRSWIESLSPDSIQPMATGMSRSPRDLYEAVGAVRFSLGDYDSAAELFRRALDGFNGARDIGRSAEVSCILAASRRSRRSVRGHRLASRAVAGARGLGVDWSLAHPSPFSAASHANGLDGARPSTPGRGARDRAASRRTGLGRSDPRSDRCRGFERGEHPSGPRLLLEAVGCCRETRHMEGMAFCLEIGAVSRSRKLALPNGPSPWRGRRDPRAPRHRGAANDEAGRDALVAALVETLGADENESALTEGRAADPFALLS